MYNTAPYWPRSVNIHSAVGRRLLVVDHEVLDDRREARIRTPRSCRGCRVRTRVDLRASCRRRRGRAGRRRASCLESVASRSLGPRAPPAIPSSWFVWWLRRVVLSMRGRRRRRRRARFVRGRARRRGRPAAAAPRRRAPFSRCFSSPFLCSMPRCPHGKQVPLPCRGAAAARPARARLRRLRPTTRLVSAAFPGPGKRFGPTVTPTARAQSPHFGDKPKTPRPAPRRRAVRTSGASRKRASAKVKVSFLASVPGRLPGRSEFWASYAPQTHPGSTQPTRSNEPWSPTTAPPTTGPTRPSWRTPLLTAKPSAPRPRRRRRRRHRHDVFMAAVGTTTGQQKIADLGHPSAPP